MFAAQGRSGFGRRWFIEIEIRPTLGATCGDLLVDAARASPFERAVDGVERPASRAPAERRGGHPRVVVDHVELARARVTGERVAQLGQRAPDQLARRLLEDVRSFAFVSESPEAKSVTSCPASTSPSASSETTARSRRSRSAGPANQTGTRSDAQLPSLSLRPRCTCAILDANVPRARRTRGSPVSRTCRPRSGSSRGRVESRWWRAVGLQPEQELQQQHGRPGRPGLRPRRRRIRDRERRRPPAAARRRPRAAGSRSGASRVEHPPHDPVRLRPSAP